MNYLFKEQLRSLRTQNNLTQKQVADFLGLNRTTYVKYEKGDSEPPIKTLLKLSSYFGVSLDALITGSTPPSPSADLASYAEQRFATATALTDMGVIPALSTSAPLTEDFISAFQSLSPAHQALVMERIQTLHELQVRQKK